MAAQTTSQSADRAKIEQIVAEFYAKSLHIIIDSRIPSLTSQNYPDESHHSAASTSPRSRSTNKWFNLEMENCAAVVECVEPWRRGCPEPMTVDVLLQQPSGELPSPSSGGGGTRYPGRENLSGDSWSGDVEGCASPGGLCKTILERWVVHYTGRKKGGSCGSGSGGGKACVSGFGEGSGGAGFQRGTGGGAPLPYPSSHMVESPVVYKRTVIMLRSLYCTMRTLPAHRLFRLVNSSHHCRSFGLSYRVSSSPPPLSEGDQAAMMNNSRSFGPIETMWGRMCITVNYRHTTAVTALEITPPMEPRIITDYVGSPHTNPMRKFHSVGSVPSGGIPGRRGVHVVSLPSSVPSSPSGPSFHRRHSWSSGQAKMNIPQPLTASPSFRASRSPSPSVPTDFIPSSSPITQSPHSASPSHNLHLQLSPRTSPSRPSLPRQYASQPSSFHQVGVGHPSQPIPIHDHGRSPPYSASPSPSPPTHYSAPRSAPVSIPRPSSARPYLGSSPRRIEGPTHPSYKSPYPPPSPSRNFDALPRSVSCNSKPWTNLFVTNLEGRVAPPPLSISDWAVNSSLLVSPAHPFHTHQVRGDDKGEGGPPSGVKRSLYAPPRLLLPSRGMSKVETLDDGDEEEFSCPFAVDDEDAEGYRSRMDSPKVPQSSDAFEAVGQGHQRSQDAAVGALVRILKAAPPLRPWNLPPPVVSGSPNLRPSPPGLLGPAEMLGGGKLKCSPPRPTSTRARSGTTSLVGSPVSQSGATKVPPKTSGSALEELRSYIEMRDHLQRQSGVKLASSPAKPL